MTTYRVRERFTPASGKPDIVHDLKARTKSAAKREATRKLGWKDDHGLASACLLLCPDGSTSERYVSRTSTGEVRGDWVDYGADGDVIRDSW